MQIGASFFSCRFVLTGVTVHAQTDLEQSNLQEDANSWSLEHKPLIQALFTQASFIFFLQAASAFFCGGLCWNQSQKSPPPLKPCPERWRNYFLYRFARLWRKRELITTSPDVWFYPTTAGEESVSHQVALWCQRLHMCRAEMFFWAISVTSEHRPDAPDRPSKGRHHRERWLYQTCQKLSPSQRLQQLLTRLPADLPPKSSKSSRCSAKEILF